MGENITEKSLEQVERIFRVPGQCAQFKLWVRKDTPFVPRDPEG